LNVKQILGLSSHYILNNVNVIKPGGKILKNASVEIAKGKIVKVGEAIKDRTAVKANDIENSAIRSDGSKVEIVDLKGNYLMPGLIDAHTHFAGGRGNGDYADTDILSEKKDVRIMRSVYESQKMLKYGFTAARDVSWNSLYLKRIFAAGHMPGPKIVACGPGLARTGGHCDSPQFPLEFVRENHFWAILADGEDECRKGVRTILREGADQIKYWGSGGDNWGTEKASDTHYTFEEMKAICEEAHMIEGTRVLAHAGTPHSIKLSLEAGADSIEHGSLLTDELACFMAENGRYLVPTLYLIAGWYERAASSEAEVFKPLRPFPFLQRDINTGFDESETWEASVAESFGYALKRGVKIALGSDTVYEPIMEFGVCSIEEYKALIKYGMTIPQAIDAATIIAAEVLGLAHRIGSIEEGKEADMVVIETNPFDDIAAFDCPDKIKWVFLDGKPVVWDGRLMW